MLQKTVLALKPFSYKTYIQLKIYTDDNSGSGNGFCNSMSFFHCIANQFNDSDIGNILFVKLKHALWFIW